MSATQFRFQAEKVHLTYKTHLDYAAYKEFVKSFGELRVMSFVHENGDEEEEGNTPYAHTHVFMWWKKKYDSKNCRCFDFGQDPDKEEGVKLHPNIQTRRGIDWAKNICFKYHLGHKTKKDGKKYYIEPVFLDQVGCEEWKFEDDWERIIAEAPSVVEAAKELGIKPKSFSDVRFVAESTKKRKQRAVEENLEHNFKKLPDGFWDRKKKALVVRGIPGIGKTQWALAQFEKPFQVTQLDGIRHIPDDCDGVVFDDMHSFVSKCTKSQQINLTTPWQDRDFRLRHTNAVMPAIPRIFTCNTGEDIFGAIIDPGVERRVQFAECDELFGNLLFETQ